MKRTAIQTRKIEFVQHFLRLTQESSINRFENLLKEERLQQIEKEINKPMTIKKFNASIDKAEEDDKNGRMTSAKKLLKDLDSLK